MRELRIRLLTSPLPPALKPSEQALLEHELLLCVALGLAADLERLSGRAAGAKTWSGTRPEYRTPRPPESGLTPSPTRATLTPKESLNRTDRCPSPPTPTPPPPSSTSP